MINSNIKKQSLKIKTCNSSQPKISICELKINPLKPKFKLELYNNDAKIINLRNDNFYKNKKKGGGLRNKIKEFSKQSSKNLKFHMNNTSIKFANMITLTYPDKYPTDGKKVKYHLNRFTKFLKKHKCQYTWIIEFQKRGAPHFHLIIDKFLNKDLVSSEWFNIVDSNDEKHLKAGTKCEGLRLGKLGAKMYVRKYLKKQEQKEVPKEYRDVGRFWGHSELQKNKTVIEITEEEAINIKGHYELNLRQYFESKNNINVDFSWLYDCKKAILWNFNIYHKNLVNEYFT